MNIPNFTMIVHKHAAGWYVAYMSTGSIGFGSTHYEAIVDCMNSEAVSQKWSVK